MFLQGINFKLTALAVLDLDIEPAGFAFDDGKIRFIEKIRSAQRNCLAAGRALNDGKKGEHYLRKSGMPLRFL
jgi:hypothetical protein